MFSWKNFKELNLGFGTSASGDSPARSPLSCPWSPQSQTAQPAGATSCQLEGMALCCGCGEAQAGALIRYQARKAEMQPRFQATKASGARVRGCDLGV